MDALANDARWAAIYARSGFFYLEDLSNPIANTRTDADGKFTLRVPKARYAVAAHAQRKVGTDQESYCWLVRIDASEQAAGVNLANANMSSGTDSTSLIQTVGSDEECLAAAGERGLKKIQEFVADEKNKRLVAEKAAKDAADAERAAEERQRKADEAAHLARSRQLAAYKHPTVGVPGSALNLLYLKRYKEWQAAHDPRLDRSDWPEVLADDCATHP